MLLKHHFSVTRKKTRILACCAIMLMTAAGKSQETSTKLSVGCYGPYDTTEIDPNRFQSAGAAYIIYQAFEPLLILDPNGALKQGAASAWQVENEGRVYRFLIDSRSRWSDGSPIEAEDFVEGIKRCLYPGQNCGMRFILEPLLDANAGDEAWKNPRVSAVSPQELVVEMQSPYAIDLSVFANPIVSPFPRHRGIPLDASWGSSKRLVSNGPMMIRKISENEIVFDKNPLYHGSQPSRVDEIHFKAELPGKTTLTEYVDGDLDAVCRIDQNQYDWINQEIPKQLLLSRSKISRYIRLDLRNPKLQNLRLRQLLWKAVLEQNFHELTHLFDQNNKPLYGIVPEGFTGYHSSLKKASILAMLEEIEPLPQRTRLRLAFRAWPSNIAIARHLQRIWHRVNVDLELLPHEGSLLKLDRKLISGEVDMVYSGWIPDYPSPRAFLELFDSGSSWGSFFEDDIFSKMIAKAKAATGRANELSLYADAEAYLMEQVPLIPISSKADGILVKPYLSGARELIGSSSTIERFSNLRPE